MCTKYLAVLLLAQPAVLAVSFNSPRAYATGGYAYTITSADLNGDGIPDAAVPIYDKPGTVEILLGNKNGGLQPAVSYAVGDYPYSVAVGDFNGDGKLDLAVSNLNTVSILLGNGDGTFRAAKTYATGGSGGGQVVVADFDGDGKLDLAVGNAAERDDAPGNTVSILFGNGNGTFQAAVRYKVGSGPVGLAVGDFNGDGKPDLVATAAASNTIWILLNTGKGTFRPAVSFAVGSYPESVVTGDFNGDGNLDLAVANWGSGYVSVLFGKGNGSFEPEVYYPLSGNPSEVTIGDFNGDGKPDLAVSSGDFLWVLLNFGDGTFQPPVSYAAGGPVAAAIADFNGDGTPDAAVLSEGCVTLLFGNGRGGFHTATDITAGTEPGAIVEGDFNGDGKPDLAVANAGTNSVSILLQSTQGGFLPPVNYRVGVNPVSLVVTADFNADGNTDLAVTNSGSSTISILLGNRDGTFQLFTNVGVNGIPNALAIGDVNGDGKPDMVVGATIPGDEGGGVPYLYIFLGTGDGSFQPGVPIPLPTFSGPIVVADFNGDGKLDMAVTGFYATDDPSAFLWIYLGNGDGTFQAPTTAYSFSGYPNALVSADFNSDGKTDLALAGYGGQVAILSGNGDGTFQTAESYQVSVDAAGLAVADFNGDHKLDLAVSTGSAVTVLLGNGDGTFAWSPLFTAGDGPAASRLRTSTAMENRIWR